MNDDWQASLREWLGRQLGVGRGTVSDVSLAGVQRPDVGQSSDTFLFTLRWQGVGGQQESDFVLRVQPPAEGIFDRPDAIREARVLAGLAPAVRVPRLRWVEESGDVLGRPFFIMDQVAGIVPGAKPSIHAAGWLPTLTPEVRRHLWDEALDALVGIHATRWQRAHSFLRAGHGPTLQAHLARTRQWYDWTTRGRSFPVTDLALTQLEAQVNDVRVEEDVLVWGDARIGNMIFSGDGTLQAVLDWELATVGPPQIDLAHWLIFDDFATTTAGVERLEGFPDRAETIATYEQRANRELKDLDWFEVLQNVFLATTLIRQADIRVARGELPAGTDMGHANPVSAMLAQRIGAPVPEVSEDYRRHRATPR